MASNEKSKKPFVDYMVHSCKCEYCRGQDGRKKDIYETFQSAFDTAKFIEEDKGIFLDVYECPCGKGWHLTKSYEYSEIIERKETIFQKNDIPLKSTSGSWEYIRDETSKENGKNDTKTTIVRQKTSWDKPILKRECNAEKDKIISGKVMEIVKNANIEKIFRINLQNAFCASMIKNILDGIIDQITVYVESDQLESYTILLKNELLKNNRIKKGEQIKVHIVGTSINNISMWRCCKILK
jgi:hypothetical protein